MCWSSLRRRSSISIFRIIPPSISPSSRRRSIRAIAALPSLVNAVLRRIVARKAGDPARQVGERAGHSGVVPSSGWKLSMVPKQAARIADALLDAGSDRPDGQIRCRRLGEASERRVSCRPARCGLPAFDGSVPSLDGFDGRRMVGPGCRRRHSRQACSVRSLASAWSISAPRPAARRRSSFLPAAR